MMISWNTVPTAKDGLNQVDGWVESSVRTSIYIRVQDAPYATLLWLVKGDQDIYLNGHRHIHN